MDNEIRILLIAEERAKRFYTAGLKDYVDFYINEICPYCGRLTLIVPQSTLSLPKWTQKKIDAVMNAVSYPTVARCTMCNKILVAGFRA